MPVSDAIGALSSQCNCDCDFCHAKTLVAPTLSRTQLSLSEAATRVKYYQSKVGTGLPPITRLPLEPFSNPFSVDILREMRKAAPRELITEETNGSFLTEHAVARLAELKPLFLIISLNGVGSHTRVARMRELDAESAQTAMRSPELLRKYGIPFAISYVPWPNRAWQEMEDTVRFAEEAGATRARICFPVVHRFAYPAPPFDAEKYWQEILRVVQALRPSCSIPVATTPTIYEWQTIRPVVCGTVYDSPSARAGIRYGDVIITVEGERVVTRREVRRLLAERARNRSTKDTRVTIDRAGSTLEVRIDHSRPQAEEPYPYRELEPDQFPLGLELPEGIGLSDVMALKAVCESHQGKRLLLLLSSLVISSFMEALSVASGHLPFLDFVELHVADVQTRFWGNTWIPTRFWTVADIAASVARWTKINNLEVDAVILPAGAFSPGGRDVLGGTLVTLEQELEVEVCRVHMNRVVT